MNEMETLLHLHDLDDYFDTEEKKSQYLEIRERMRKSLNGTIPRVPLTPQELDIVTTPTFRARLAEENRKYFRARREKRANEGQIDRQTVCTMVEN